MIHPDREYTLEEVICLTGVKRQMLKKHIKGGVLKAFKHSERGHFRVIGRDLLEFLNWRERQTQPLAQAADEVSSWESLEEIVRKENGK